MTKIEAVDGKEWKGARVGYCVLYTTWKDLIDVT